jgi:hypothetical protein
MRQADNVAGIPIADMGRKTLDSLPIEPQSEQQKRGDSGAVLRHCRKMRTDPYRLR